MTDDALAIHIDTVQRRTEALRRRSRQGTSELLDESLEALDLAVAALREAEQMLAEHQRVDSARREREQRFESAFRLAPIGMALLDTDGRPFQVNRAMCETLGYTEPELLRVLPTVVHPDDMLQVVADRIRLRDGAIDSYQAERRFLHKSGRVVFGQVGVSAVRTGSGRVVQYVVHAQDITERKRVEDAYREQAARLGLLLGQLPAVVWTTDTELRFASGAGRSLTKLGLLPNQLAGVSLFEYFQTNDPEFAPLAAHCAALRGEAVDFEIAWGGHTFRARIEPLRDAVGEVTGTVGLAVDITEQKRNEDVRQTSERLFQTALQAAPIGVALLDPAGRMLRVNRTACEVLGYPEAELLGRPYVSLLHPEDLSQAIADRLRVESGEAPGYQTERRLVDKSGRIIITLASLTAVRDGNGEVIHYMAHVQDITERKRAEAALRQSEERFALAVEGANDGIWDWNINSGEIYLSARWKAILGYGEDELEDDLATWRDLVHPEDAGWLARHITASIRREAGPYYENEHRLRHRDGSYRWVNSRGLVVCNADGTVCRMVGSLTDITERKRAEETLRLHSLMLERMAEGVAVGDQQGRIRYVNPAMANMFGYEPGELVNQNVAIFNDYTSEQSVQLAMTVIEQVQLNGQFAGEFRNRRKDGTSFLTFARICKVAMAGEDLWLTLQHDISDRKLAEQALRESQELLLTFMDNSPAAVFLKDEDGHYLFVNEVLARASGRAAAEWVGITDFDWAPAEQANQLREDDRATLAANRRMEFAATGMQADGWHHWQTFKFPIEDANGRRLLGGMSIDVTEQKRAEQALRDSQALFRTFMDNSPAAAFMKDEDGRVVYVNDVIAQGSGRPAAECVGEPSTDWVAPQETEALRERDRAVLLSGARAEYVEHVMQIDGVHDWLTFRFPIVDSTGRRLLGGIAIDVTDRIRAEEALRQSEERFALAMAAVRDGLWDWNVEQGYLYLSPRSKDIIGFEDHEMGGHLYEWIRRIHDADFMRLIGELHAHLDGVMMYFQEECRVLHKDGSYRWVSIRGRVIRNAAGAPYRMLGSLTDVTERRRMQDELRESEERFRKIFEEGPIGVGLLGLDYRLVQVNPAYCRQLGYTREELIGHTLAEVTHPDDVDPSVDLLNDVFAGKGSSYHFRKRYLRKDGSILWANLTTAVICDTNGKPLYAIGMVEDVTRRMRAEQEAAQRQAELAHALRVSTMGEMAAGLAHELNQPLSAIVSYARGCVHRMQGGTVESSELLNAIEQVVAQAMRGGEILQRYRSFLRTGAPRREWVDINELAQEAVRFGKAGMRETGTTIRLDLAPILPRIQADSVQLEQVILNLVRNALDAMRECDRAELCLRTSSGPEGIEVAVQDGGCGISPTLGERIFDAFVTTKADGLGLGLSISRSIIEAHGGRLWATPNPDRGTTFRFTLPSPEGGSGRGC